MPHVPAENGGLHGAEGKGRAQRWGANAKALVQEAAQDVVTLFRHPVYVCTIAGQTLYTGAPLFPCGQSI